MKKTLLAIVSLSLLLSLAACTPAAPEKKPEESSASSGMENEEDFSSNSTTNTAVYGKISGIAGNELELSLAKDPYADLLPGSDVQGVETAIPGAKVHISEEVGAAGGAAGDDTAPKMKLEYTGENESYTIPAGVKITGKNGGEAQLADLKKGSVLTLLMENDRITEIMILE